MVADWPEGRQGRVWDPDPGPLRCWRVDHQVQPSVPHRWDTQLDLLQRPDWKQPGETGEEPISDVWIIKLKHYSAPAPSSVPLSCCPLAPRSFMETRTGPHQCRTSCGLQLWRATSASFPSGGTHVLLCAWSCCSAWINAAKPLLVSGAPPTPVNPNPHPESVWTPVQQQAPNHKKFLFRNTKKNQVGHNHFIQIFVWYAQWGSSLHCQW